MAHRVHLSLLAPLFFLLGAASPPAPPAAPTPSTLSMDGFGDLRIGMSRAQVEALGRTVTPDDILYDPAHPETCWEGRVGIDHVIAMFDDDKLVRLTATHADVPVEGGALVGMGEPEVQALYEGQLVVEPHAYLAKGHYLKLFSGDRARALVLETDGTRVTLVHAGEAEHAQYVEGCL
jgi:hypothetical protein